MTLAPHAGFKKAMEELAADALRLRNDLALREPQFRDAASDHSIEDDYWAAYNGLERVEASLRTVARRIPS